MSSRSRTGASPSPQAGAGVIIAATSSFAIVLAVLCALASSSSGERTALGWQNATDIASIFEYNGTAFCAGWPGYFVHTIVQQNMTMEEYMEFNVSSLYNTGCEASRGLGFGKICEVRTRRPARPAGDPPLRRGRGLTRARAHARTQPTTCRERLEWAPTDMFDHLTYSVEPFNFTEVCEDSDNRDDCEWEPACVWSGGECFLHPQLRCSRPWFTHAKGYEDSNGTACPSEYCSQSRACEPWLYRPDFWSAFNSSLDEGGFGGEFGNASDVYAWVRYDRDGDPVIPRARGGSVPDRNATAAMNATAAINVTDLAEGFEYNQTLLCAGMPELYYEILTSVNSTLNETLTESVYAESHLFDVGCERVSAGLGYGRVCRAANCTERPEYQPAYWPPDTGHLTTLYDARNVTETCLELGDEESCSEHAPVCQWKDGSGECELNPQLACSRDWKAGSPAYADDRDACPSEYCLGGDGGYCVPELDVSAYDRFWAHWENASASANATGSGMDDDEYERFQAALIQQLTGEVFLFGGEDPGRYGGGGARGGGRAPGPPAMDRVSVVRQLGADWAANHTAFCAGFTEHHYSNSFGARCFLSPEQYVHEPEGKLEFELGCMQSAYVPRARERARYQIRDQHERATDGRRTRVRFATARRRRRRRR